MLLGLPLGQRHELLARGLGLGRVDEVARVQPRQRAHAVPAVLRARAILMNGNFMYDQGRTSSAMYVGVVLVVDVVEDLLAVRVDGAQAAVVEVHRAVVRGSATGGSSRTSRTAASSARCSDRVVLADLQRAARPGEHLLEVLQQEVALRDRQVLVDAAGDGAGAVDLLAGRARMISWPYLRIITPCTARSGNFWRHADDVADGRVGVEPEQQVRARPGGRSAARATGRTARSASAGASSRRSA